MSSTDLDPQGLAGRIEELLEAITADGGPAVGHSGGFLGINSKLDMYLGSGWTAIVMSNYSQGAGPVQTKMTRLIAASGN